MNEDAQSPGHAPQGGKDGARVVVVRLVDWSHIELGSFDDEEAALECASDFVNSAIRNSDSGWPLAANRFVRPEAIVSVDVVAGNLPKWSGSTARARWARSPDGLPDGSEDHPHSAAPDDRGESESAS